MTEAQEIIEVARKIYESDEWNLEDCKALCKLAGLGEEWENADGDSFEAVVKKAAKKLGVEIIKEEN